MDSKSTPWMARAGARRKCCYIYIAETITFYVAIYASLICQKSQRITSISWKRTIKCHRRTCSITVKMLSEIDFNSKICLHSFDSVYWFCLCTFALVVPGVYGSTTGQGEIVEELRQRKEMGHHMRSSKFHDTESHHKIFHWILFR